MDKIEKAPFCKGALMLALVVWHVLFAMCSIDAADAIYDYQ